MRVKGKSQFGRLERSLALCLLCLNKKFAKLVIDHVANKSILFDNIYSKSTLQLRWRDAETQYRIWSNFVKLKNKKIR
jgi:hypothetical protein